MRHHRKYWLRGIVTGVLITAGIAAMLWPRPVVAEPEIVTVVRTEYVPAVTQTFVDRLTQKEVLPEEEELLFCQIVAGEAAYEPWEGIAAVAECLKNHLAEAPMDEIRPLFCGWMEEVPYYVTVICRAVLYDDLEVLGDSVKYFYSPTWTEGGVSYWHESQEYLGSIGNHRFFR